MDVSEDGYQFWEIDKTEPLYTRYPRIIQFLEYNPFQPFDTSSLSGKMKKNRIENGLSQEDVGKLVGVNESTIYAWEKGKHNPFPSKIKPLEKLISFNKEPT